MPSLRKIIMILHVATSAGLIGGVLCFLVLAVAGLTGGTNLYAAADLIARLIVLPLASAALAIGIVQSLVSPWGLVQHYWVIVKLVATAFVLAVLVLQLPGITALGSMTVSEIALPQNASQRLSLVLHAGTGLVPLALCLVLSIFKPKGLTPYGWRKTKGALKSAMVRH
ncbi:hypothetical protein VW35_15175 [Devosia soli]|uniref:DUF2269 domain-containing protein n=1 Tax=Devosia soli TaxID=361041 RepID=A0A0F5L4Z5_9HYPH|nr:hypothetical protein [Devosia soli]KKB77481.1 hypothetical protein VW35_15175 [Devosia soli]